MADPKHPRKFSEEFKRQILQLYDNAAIESMNKTLKTASVYRRSYSTIDELRHEVNSYVRWYNNERMHSTLGYMSPVEFREAGLSL